MKVIHKDWTNEVSKPFLDAKVHDVSFGVWRVESFGEDGECYIADFCGPDAEARANQYRKFLLEYNK